MRKAFTIIEILIVVAIIAILSLVVITYAHKAQAKSKLARVSSELSDIAKAVTQYADDNSYQFPADASRSVPPGLEKYLQGGVWPTSVWPHGVFDWDNWIYTALGPNNGKQIYQITYRLCNVDDPIQYCSDATLFPHFTRYSSIFYCIFGPCVPHVDYVTDPGYCVNCNPKEVNPPL